MDWSSLLVAAEQPQVSLLAAAAAMASALLQGQSSPQANSLNEALSAPWRFPVTSKV